MLVLTSCTCQKDACPGQVLADDVQQGLADPRKATSVPQDREREGLCGEAGGDPSCVGTLITPQPAMGLSRMCSRGILPISARPGEGNQTVYMVASVLSSLWKNFFTPRTLQQVSVTTETAMNYSTSALDYCDLALRSSLHTAQPLQECKGWLDSTKIWPSKPGSLNFAKLMFEILHSCTQPWKLLLQLFWFTVRSCCLGSNWTI